MIQALKASWGVIRISKAMAERTLVRYSQAADGFKEGLSLKAISEKTGWKIDYIEKIYVWWQEAFPHLKPHLEKRTSDNRDTSTGLDHQSVILSKLVKSLYDIRDQAVDMTNRFGHGENKAQYLEPFLKMGTEVCDEFLSVRVFLPIEFVQKVEDFLRKWLNLRLFLGWPLILKHLVIIVLNIGKKLGQ